MNGAVDRPPVSGGDERGVILIIFAVMLVVLIAFGALVLDMGQLFTVRRELQNSADASALAGSLQFDRTLAGLDHARAQVRAYASQHVADFRESEVSDEDIVFGHWSSATDTFTPIGSFPTASEARRVNAVRVVDRRADATAVQLRLGWSLRRQEMNVSSAAVAISGGPDDECAFPMVVADCSLEEALESGSCEQCFVYQDQPGAPSNAAWTTLSSGPGMGVPHIRDVVASACFDESGNPLVDPLTGECIGQCASVHSGEEADVHRGNMLSQGASNFCPLIQQILERDGPARSFTVRVPVLETSSGTCDLPNSAPIAGFATLEIYGARCGNNDPGIFAADAPDCGAPPSGKVLLGSLRCDLESEHPPGGAYFGTDSRRARLVR